MSSNKKVIYLDANKIKMYIDSKFNYILSDDPIEINCETAVDEILKFPTSEEYDGGFIGFENNRDEVIQFVRNHKDDWLIDVPINIEGHYSHSLQDNGLSTSDVLAIIRAFCHNDSWKGYCNLKQ